MKDILRASRRPTFLRNWRVFRKLTQQQAAERLEIADYTTIGRIERGVLPYNQDFLECAALAYGCDVEDLLSIDPLKPDGPKLIYSKMRGASPEMQKRIVEVVEALLKAG